MLALFAKCLLYFKFEYRLIFFFLGFSPYILEHKHFFTILLPYKSDILFYFLVVLCRNEALRVAFIHEEETVSSDGKPLKEYYSKLLKADVHGKDQVGAVLEIYSVNI